MDELKVFGVEICSAIREIVEKSLQTDKYEIRLEPASKLGDNMSGIIYSVQFRSFDREKSVLKMVVKAAPRNPGRRTFCNIPATFSREIFLYEKVLPIFRKYQDEKGIVSKEIGFYEYPDCYKTMVTDLNECLILEDLRASKMTMIDHRTEPITTKHVELVLKALGKFHAISFALKDQQPKKFIAIASQMDEVVVWRPDQRVCDTLHALKKYITESPNADRTNDAVIGKLEELCGRNVTFFEECVNGSVEPNAVLCHGDCWTNNQMFKYDEKTNPIEVRLIDWQLSRYASPVCDFLCYVFTSTTKELRDKQYDTWIKVYHESLKNLLNALGSDADFVFSYDALLDQLKKYGKFGFVMATLLLQMMTSEEPIDIEQLVEDYILDKKTPISEKSHQNFMERIMDVFVDMIQLGYV